MLQINLRFITLIIFLRDMMPYYAFGNTKDDNVGFLKWAFIN